MNQIEIPKDYNYIEAYLTYKCNMSCSYCINKHGMFTPIEPLSTIDWIEALKKIKATRDLPITLGGGEPTIYPGFYELVRSIPNGTVDLLTNGTFDVVEFMKNIPMDKFNRGAKYASIRFSLHYDTNMELVINNLVDLNKNGYSVGIWAVDHPVMTSILLRVHDICKQYKIDFRVKDYLGYYNGKLYGRYRYPNAIGKPYTSVVKCRSSELLIAPGGEVFECHADLYSNRNSIGNILSSIRFSDHKECSNFGQCNPCDIKLKYNRFQEFGHCSMEIKQSI